MSEEQQKLFNQLQEFRSIISSWGSREFMILTENNTTDKPISLILDIEDKLRKLRNKEFLGGKPKPEPESYLYDPIVRKKLLKDINRINRNYGKDFKHEVPTEEEVKEAEEFFSRGK